MDEGTIAGAIIAAASIIAGALRWVASVLGKRIDNHAKQIGGHADALGDNSRALDDNTRAHGGKISSNPRLRSMPVVLLFVLFALGVAGCPSTDPMILRALERNQEVWEEDRRADLDPELVKSRIREFEAQQRYAKAPK